MAGLNKIQQYFLFVLFICYASNNAHSQNDPILDDSSFTKHFAFEKFYPVEAFTDSNYNALEFLSAGREIPVLSTVDVFKLFKEKLAVFIDSREPDEFADGHIPGALNIPYDSVSAPISEKKLSQIPRDTRIIVYCNTHLCIVSKTGAEGIIFNGFTRVIIAEGFLRWKELSFPIEANPTPEVNNGD